MNPAPKPTTPFLLKGGSMLKLGRRGKPHDRTFTLDPSQTHLSWVSPNIFKSAEHTTIDLTNVSRLTTGQSTIPFLKNTGHSKVSAGNAKKRSLSLHYYNLFGVETSLDVVCNTDESYASLHTELTALLSYHDNQKLTVDRRVLFALRQFSEADFDRNGQLSTEEITNLVYKLNMNCSADYVKMIFNECDIDKSGFLDIEEFERMLEKLSTRTEVLGIWCGILDGSIFDKIKRKSVKDYVSGKKNVETMTISIEAFMRFLNEVQMDDVKIDEVRKRIVTLHGSVDYGGGVADDSKIHYSEFKNYLSSPTNYCYSMENQSNVYQDMTHPISNYWISSSHNTYCEGDQLKSYSSVSRYINDLIKSCRCVELDCWDGDNGVPIIYHGHTLTGKILFSDVIEAVAEYGFKSSEYPIILSLENHCTIPQQVLMAEYMVNILGDLLMIPSLNEEGYMACPAECKGKVIVKAKRLAMNQEEEGYEHEGPDPDAIEQEMEQNKAKLISKEEQRDGSRRRQSTERSSIDSPSPKSIEKKKKAKVAQELHDITYLSGVHFLSWEQSANEAAANEMSSFSEPKTDRLILKNPAEWTTYNKRQLSRIYPGGSRIDSSNYNPVPSWNVGSQIVALNYQTPGLPMQLNDGKYLDNGKSGYVLKPECMRSTNASSFDPINGPWPAAESFNFTIEVISGFQLPKPGGAKKGEVIDPYVKVELHGIPRDEAKFCTKTVQDNGFNPVFNETFEFDVKMKSLGMLYIAVYDYDYPDADDFIGYAGIPLGSLKEGVRSVDLNSWSSSNGGEFQFASVLVNVTVKKE